MKAICFLTPEDAAFGFAMTGIEQRTTRPEVAEEALRAALADGAIGLVALDERLLSGISEETLLWAERRRQGILVVLPAPAMGALGGDYVNQLVSRAIGYQVRLD